MSLGLVLRGVSVFWECYVVIVLIDGYLVVWSII